MRKLTTIGTIISFLWIAAFGWLLVSEWGLAAEMNPNEWGDFLAGLTAPLALIWLVIGYFLQGKELRVNTEALRAQQEELRRQVEETAQLVATSARQASATEAALELSTSAQQAQQRDDHG